MRISSAMLATSMLATAAFAMPVLTSFSACAAEPASDRLRALIFERKYEHGDSYPHMVDLPLWTDTRYLLEGQSQERLVKLLDEVAAQELDATQHGLRRRALLQHELWQLFDWTTDVREDQGATAKALRSKLARAMRHVALTKAEIGALATNLPQSDANAGGGGAPNVLDEKQGWVHVGLPDATPIGERHLNKLLGRSAFGVYLRCGADPDVAKAYLKQLAEFPFPLAFEEFSGRYFTFDPALPRIPLGSQVGLLQRMLLVDVDGEPASSPIVQSLQLRTFLKIEPDARPEHFRMQEFRLDRASYLAGKSGPMFELKPTDVEPTVFLGHDVDLFEFGEQARRPEPVLERCMNCHGTPGALSINVFTGKFVGIPQTNRRLGVAPFEREIDLTLAWKREQPSWKMLRESWNAAAQ